MKDESADAGGGGGTGTDDADGADSAAGAANAPGSSVVVSLARCVFGFGVVYRQFVGMGALGMSPLWQCARRCGECGSCAGGGGSGAEIK